MNREILFRGQLLGTGEWKYGGFYEGYGVGIIVENGVVPTFNKVYRKTVGQFTGLHDSTKWENDGLYLSFDKYTHLVVVEDA